MLFQIRKEVSESYCMHRGSNIAFECVLLSERRQTAVDGKPECHR